MRKLSRFRSGIAAAGAIAFAFALVLPAAAALVAMASPGAATKDVEDPKLDVIEDDADEGTSASQQ